MVLEGLVGLVEVIELFRGELCALDEDVLVVVLDVNVNEVRGAVLELVEVNDPWRNSAGGGDCQSTTYMTHEGFTIGGFGSYSVTSLSRVQFITSSGSSG